MRRPAQVPLDQTGFPLTLAGGLRTAFADVLSNPLPGHLAALMRRLSADRDERSGEEPSHGASATETSSRIDRRGRRELRSLMAALFEEQIDTIECESAEAALATLLIGGREVATIFADVRLRGVMNGIDLACEVKIRWPLLPVILTSGHPLERIRELPPGVAYMPKPWQPLNVLIAAERALPSRGDVPR
jgi:CheY-like chemotaxis protein